jgi:taurine dioxygenase
MSEPALIPLSPFGLEIKGVDLREVDDEFIQLLERRLGEHGFVLFRDQTLDDAGFVALLERLGPLKFTLGETPVDGQPMLNVVTNVGRTKPPRSVFHTDTSYVPEPPAYTALRVVQSAAAGGETLFADQYRAFESLPPSIRERLTGINVLHAVTGLDLGPDEVRSTWHPLVRRHPSSGRSALFLSTPERCVELSGDLADRGKRIIELLFRPSIRPSRQFRHAGREGDVVIWDDRCTMHGADHTNVSGDRTLHRGMVAGDKPIPAECA